MKITEEVFNNLERHNKIQLTPSEKRLIKRNLQAIVHSMDVLKEIAIPERIPEFRVPCPQGSQREDQPRPDGNTSCGQFSVPNLLAGKGEER